MLQITCFKCLLAVEEIDLAARDQLIRGRLKRLETRAVSSTGIIWAARCTMFSGPDVPGVRSGSPSKTRIWLHIRSWPRMTSDSILLIISVDNNRGDIPMKILSLKYCLLFILLSLCMFPPLRSRITRRQRSRVRLSKGRTGVIPAS